MNAPPLTKTYLESLSTGELTSLAEGFGIDIPYGLDRILVIGELLEYGLDEKPAAEEAADAGLHHHFKEVAVLPKQYNISFIEVLIRDPLWAFVFWEVKGHDREVYEKEPDFEGYCLRAVALAADADYSFSVPVGINDTAWYFGFPSKDIRRYKIEICALIGDRRTALAVSRPFSLPRLLDSPIPEARPADGPAAYPRSPAWLSGANEFPVIRDADRHLRIRV